MKKISLPLFLILALASLLWLPNLFAKGMFMDGVYDALFAHNLAQGISTFWSPQTIYYSQPAYWDNPQLSSFLLSLFYKLFGDTYQVEKVYSLACAVVQLILLATVWRVYFKENEALKKYAWLPCLLFLISPLIGWCYSNNLMENTMSVFTTASVLIFLLFLRMQKNVLPLAAASGAFIFLALITKGPVALFPLVAPLFFVLEENFSWKKSLAYISLQTFVFIAISTFVFSFQAPTNFLHHYLEGQLLPALKDNAPSTASHFRVFYDLVMALLPLMALAVVSLFAFRSKVMGENKSLLRSALIFILIGLSASVPIVLSAKQHHYYLLPSLPMFALGFACLIFPSVKWLEAKGTKSGFERGETVLKFFCLVVITTSVFLSVKNAGTFSRDEILLTDLEKIQSLTQNQNVIRADWKLFDQWALRGYLNRLYDKKICMPDETAATNFYLTKPNEWGDRLPTTAQKIYSGKTLDLYRIQP